MNAETIRQRAFEWMRAAVNVSHGRWPDSDLTEAKEAFEAALREGSLPDRANPARDESPKAIEPGRDSDAPR